MPQCNTDHEQGYLVVDKPAGITSRDAVDHVQQWFPKTKLGHAGTLDPAATGVLVVGVGSSATRFIEYLQDQEKQYRTTIRLDGTSTTDDADGEITLRLAGGIPEEADVRQALLSFSGTTSQVPPAYSAAKVDGVRAHTKARRGEQLTLQPRQVTIYEVTLLRFGYPELELDIRCSKGTYIRSIARDLGKVLGTGGYVQKLRRTRIGSLTCEQAVPWNATVEQVRQHLLPLSTSVEHLAHINLNQEQARRLQQGQCLSTTLGEVTGQCGLWYEDQFIGVGLSDAQGSLLRPVKMVAVTS